MELKHCPFCGGTEAEVNDISSGYPWLDHPLWEAGCPDCGFWVKGESAEEVVAAWNRRYPHESVPLPGAVKPVLAENQDVRYVKKWVCPTCSRSFIGSIQNKFCYHCGQEFDWRILGNDGTTDMETWP